MVQALLIFLFTWLLAEWMVGWYQDRLRHPRWVFTVLFLWHTLFFLAYYTYVQFNRSDSYAYIQRALDDYYGPGWFGQYGTGTRFITWFSYPFANYLGFTYESMMLVCSFLGFAGVFFIYLFMTERTVYRHRYLGIDFLLLIFFLPNMHFWTASLGKGAITFFGLGLTLFGVSRLGKRYLLFLTGAWMLYHVRPHIFLVLLLSSGIAVLFSSRQVRFWQKAIVVVAALMMIAPLMEILLQYARIEELNEEAVSDFFSHRTQELKKGAGSAVNIEQYSQPIKLFTFWFRPLFVDAPNFLGLFTSLENLLYLVLFLKLFSKQFIKYILQAHWTVKASFFGFLGISFALAQISSNLGLAIRQKSQVMYLFLFVLISYADWMYQRYGKEII